MVLTSAVKVKVAPVSRGQFMFQHCCASIRPQLSTHKGHSEVNLCAGVYLRSNSYRHLDILQSLDEPTH